ncbi:MAG: hypothetical protein O7H41_14360 [Planctomycetota bacterium]|nr:hypothetical protein [Planctomycetota bacterium]
MHAESEARTTRAEFSYDEEPIQNAEFVALFRSEFPKPETGADDRGPGPSFLIELQPDPESAEHGSLHAQLMWSKHPAHLFQWFASLEDWRHAREEGERLVRDVGGGGRVYLSLESGLIDEMTHPGGMHLKLIEWRRTAGDSQFVIPEPKEGAEDVTEEMVRYFVRRAVPKRRVLLYEAALEAKEHSPGDTEQLREKLTRVFEALYRPETVRNYGEWMAKTAAATEVYAAWYGEQHDRHADDPATWKTVEDMGAQRRTELDEVLSRQIKMWTERIDPPDPEMGDPAFLATIADVERETLRSVYQREIATPLLGGFDEAIRSVEVGD